jgi:hypothetical protein
MMTRPVSSSPDQPGRRLDPGQSSHQKAIIATAGSANVTSGPSTSAEGSGPPAPTAISTATGTTSNRPARPRAGGRAKRPRPGSAGVGLRAAGLLIVGRCGSARDEAPTSAGCASGTSGEGVVMRGRVQRP